MRVRFLTGDQPPPRPHTADGRRGRGAQRKKGLATMSAYDHPTISAEQARLMFRRTIAAWSADTARLARLGLDRPAARRLFLDPRGGAARPPRGAEKAAAHLSSPPAQERAA